MVLLVVAAAASTVSTRLSHPSIPVYVAAGFIANSLYLHQNLLQFAHLGAIFLVFVLGLRLEPDRLESVAKQGFGAAATTSVVAGVIAYTAGSQVFDSLNALYLGFAAALSSSVIGLDMVERDLDIDLLHGRLTESVQLYQDFFAVIAIVFIGAASSTDPAASVLYGLATVVAALVFRDKAISRLAESIERSRELTMLTALTVLAVFIGASEVSGMPTVVGSFAAGLAMAKFPYNEESLEAVSPLKDFFAAVFFISIGSMISVPGSAALAVAALVFSFAAVLRPLLAAAYFLEQGYDHRTSFLTGFSLDQVSEFALVVAIQAFIAGTMNQSIFQGIVLAAVASMSLSSYTTRHREKLVEWMRKLGIDEKSDLEEAEGVQNHVVVVGYAQQGKMLCEELDEPVLVENDPEKVTEAERRGITTVFGDALQDETWEAAKSREAEAIVSTVPDRRVSESVLRKAPEDSAFLRAETMAEAAELMEEGAVFAEVPDITAAERLKHHIQRSLQQKNYPEELRRRNLLEIRKRTREFDE